MIKLKFNLKGIIFNIEIDRKKVTYEDFKGKVQWFPPIDPKVMAMLTEEEYKQWQNARTEDEIARIIRIDALRNGAILIKEERI